MHTTVKYFYKQQLGMLYRLENNIADHSIDNVFCEIVISILHHVYHRNQLTYLWMGNFFVSLSLSQESD